MQPLRDRVDHTERRLIDLRLVQDVRQIRADFVTDTGGVRARRRDRQKQTLIPLRRAGFKRVVQATVAMQVQFVDDGRVKVLAVRRLRVSRYRNEA